MAGSCVRAMPLQRLASEHLNKASEREMAVNFIREENLWQVARLYAWVPCCVEAAWPP